ncbi:ATP-binding protein [Sphaerisporangium rufum]|uniref:ATP-binding protein n=1 Tax=Sphaerisporangium rufum TaxID=1381558 RepID=A0A919QXE5_9ACTN|nr:ATP-binding protein [Sphaerisporangium rufum]GII75894.1 ATP-binding protein [Sphaerisporangium rufum]
MSGSTDGQHAVRWNVPQDPTVLGDLRDMMRRTLADWGLRDPADVADDIVLAATEVLGNAVLYGLGPITFTLRVTGETLCAEVTDHGAGRPVYGGTGADDEHGRGLVIVEVLSDEWGVSPGPGGTAKTVWFRKRCPAAAGWTLPVR